MENTKKSTNYRKIIIPLISLSLLVFLNACSNKDTAENTVDQVFKSAKTLDIETLEELVDKEAKDEIDESLSTIKGSAVDEEDTEEIDYKDVKGSEEFYNNMLDLQSDLSHKIIEVEEAEDTAKVKVEAEFVDGQELISAIIRDYFSEALGQALTNTDTPSQKEASEMIIKTFNKNYSVFEKELITDQFDIHLVKNEDGEWLVSEIDNELMNALTFNSIDGIDNMFSQFFDGFGENTDESANTLEIYE